MLEKTAELSRPSSANWLLRVMKRLKNIKPLFLLIVVIPTLIAIFYYGLIASDVYTSESRFVVRSPERQSSSPLGLIFKGAGFSRSQDDAYTVQDYIQSRDALRDLDSHLKIKAHYSQSEIDFLSRFAGITFDNSFEAFHLYYQKKVAVQLDSLSSIATLTVKAFTAEDAVKINKSLIDMSEALVNRLNERGRQDMLNFAKQEVAIAEKKATEAALALSTYRNQKGVIDPERQSSIQLQQVAKLQEELIATQTQLAQLRTFTKDNPQIPSLQKRLETLQNAVSSENEKITGGEKSLANKAGAYQRLLLEREFADKQLASAMISLEQARSDAARKLLYLERIAEPSTPDAALEPKRLRGCVAVFLLSLVIYGVFTIFIAGVREHAS